jgi:hypothetical protein
LAHQYKKENKHQVAKEILHLMLREMRYTEENLDLKLQIFIILKLQEDKKVKKAKVS